MNLTALPTAGRCQASYYKHMKLTVKDAADLVGGKVYGDSNFEIQNISKIQEAKPGDLTFLYLSSYQKHFETTKASVILIKPDHEKNRDDIIYIEVDNPDVALQKIIVKYFNPELILVGIDKSASVHSSAKIGSNVAFGKNVVISENCEIGDDTKIYHNTVLMENVKVGKNSLIYPNVSIREDCILGNNVIVHSGTVIGSDGFGYTPNEKGEYIKVPQIGNVIIEDEVELGSNVSIDRAAIGSTIIRKGAKIDNLVQIAHNVEVGENTAMAGQVGIAGSTKIGKNCIFGGQAGVTGHIEITDGVLVGAQSGISKSILESGKFFGSPAMDLSKSLRQEVYLRNLPKYIEQIKTLEKKIKELENRFNTNKKEES